MDLSRYIIHKDERPLDQLVDDGGFFSIFRTCAVIGDSLSSGEMESLNNDGVKGYHDYYDYSWGQYMARRAGNTVLNFSQGGMSAKQYWQSFGEANGFWDIDKACQAYIFALGANDLGGCNQPVGSVDDIGSDPDHCCETTFAGWFGKVFLRYRQIAPKARFFLVTMVRENNDGDQKRSAQAQLMRAIADRFDFTYCIDLFQYGPVYDDAFKNNFFLGGHMNAAGYKLTADMIMSYIDYLVRKNPEDFAQAAFIGKGGIHNVSAKW